MTLIASDTRGSLVQLVINHENLYDGNLLEYFQAFFFLSEGLNNPYHNFRHGTHVLFLAHHAARFHQRDLTRRKIRNLMIAAIFHDYNHSGAAGNDATNIGLAIKGLEKVILPIDKPHLGDIKLLLQGTQFPYIIKDLALPLEGLILRDADLMQPFSVAWIQQVIFGLAAEWKERPIEVLKRQERFLEGIKFKTAWGRFIVPETSIRLKINEALALYDLLTQRAESEEIRKVQLAMTQT